jgi:predicted unusual protein kinase regulating ubiquinone biosynthesis (AarF/ABC1/UbiB family)
MMCGAAGGEARRGCNTDGVAASTRNLGRLSEIAQIAVKHGFGYFFEAHRLTDLIPGHRAARLAEAMEDGGAGSLRGQHLRELFEELGPTFVKFGQLLSTRPDVVPPDVVAELRALQDDVRAFPFEQVERVVEDDLGNTIERLFLDFEQRPVAAASIGQVHRATLDGGERVVVKVQRPTARDEIMRDLGLLELFAEQVAERDVFRRVVDVPAVVEHLSSSLRRELDFCVEANNIDRLREVLEPYSRLDVPRVHGEFTSSRLLVLEDIQGVPIRQAPPGPARTEAAGQLVEAYYRQILTDGFFHADPHPGNLLWWRDRIYFLDLGMVGEVAPEVRELVLLLLLAFWQEDVPFLADVVLMLGGAGTLPDDMEAFERELGELFARYRHTTLSEIQLGPVIQQVTEVSAAHGVRLPASLALTGKALAQMQLAAAELDPTLDPLSVVGTFLRRHVAKQVRGAADPKRLFYDAQKLRARATRLVEGVERVVGARPGQRLQVTFRGVELEDTIRRAARQLALAFTAAGTWTATGVTAASDQVGDWAPVTLGAAAAALTVLLLGDLWRHR